MDYKQRLRRAMEYLREYAAIARKDPKLFLQLNGILVICAGGLALAVFLGLALISLSFAFIGLLLLFGIGICILALAGKAIFGDDRFVEWLSSKSKEMRELREQKNRNRQQ